MLKLSKGSFPAVAVARLLIMYPGVPTYRLDLFNRLARDFDTEALLYGSAREKSLWGFSADSVQRQVTFPCIVKDRGLYVGRHLVSRIYSRVISEFCPDVILTHELGIATLAGILLKRRLGYMHVVTIDDSPYIAKHCSWLRERLRRYVLGHIDAALVANPEVATYLNGIYPQVKVRYVTFPIVQDEERIRKEYHRAFSLASSGKRILFVGRLEKEKRVDLLIAAFAKEIGRKSEGRGCWTLDIVGEGSLKKILQKQVEDLSLQGRVHFAGQQEGERLWQYYADASITVLCSESETFGAVVNEALIAGSRVLVSSRAGSAWLVNSGNGRVFDFDSPGSLQQQLHELMEVAETCQSASRPSQMPETFEWYYQRIIEGIAQC